MHDRGRGLVARALRLVAVVGGGEATALGAMNRDVLLDGGGRMMGAAGRRAGLAGVAPLGSLSRGTLFAHLAEHRAEGVGQVAGEVGHDAEVQLAAPVAGFAVAE